MKNYGLTMESIGREYDIIKERRGGLVFHSDSGNESTFLSVSFASIKKFREVEKYHFTFTEKKERTGLIINQSTGSIVNLTPST